jgi:hypothetical protein
MKRWEYFSFTPSRDSHPRDIINLLTDYGKGGWELVIVNEGIFYLKRLLPPVDRMRENDGTRNDGGPSAAPL